jgi:hypothetical protein
MAQGLKRYVMLCIAIAIFGFMVESEIIQWVKYYYYAPFDFEECRSNSFGCKEAAEYLDKSPALQDYALVADPNERMTVDVYLNYFLLHNGRPALHTGLFREKKGIFYVLWAPDAHPERLFTYQYKHFREKYPDEKPIKTINYPNGLPAIYIFKIENQVKS